MILDADTGKISIADSTSVQAGVDYTVTATPTGTGYTGTKTAVAKIEITASDVSTLAFSYDDTSVVFETAETVNPTKGFPASAGMRYLRTGTTPFPAGISVSIVTGDVSILDTTAVMAEATYTITASPSGVGYTGTKTATIKIEIKALNISTNTFSYEETSIAVGTAKTVAPTKDFPEEAGVKYTLKTGTFPAGISLDENSGEISIVANTAVVPVPPFNVIPVGNVVPVASE
jgi:hypothetical protein